MKFNLHMRVFKKIVYFNLKNQNLKKDKAKVKSLFLIMIKL